MAPRGPLPMPMKAISGPVPTDEGWAFEVKWDGMRVIAEVDGSAGGGVRLSSANGIDVTGRFPELAGLTAHLGGHRAVLDGEVVAFDEAGRTDFGRLQPRMHTNAGPKQARLIAEVPITYVVFDLLWLDDHDLTGLPYTDRRRLLTDLVEASGSWTVPGHQVGHGEDLYQAAAERGLEGIVAKRLDSTYRPGKRSPAWRKCKVRRGQEVVVGGWTAGAGARASSLGALLVGVHDPDAPGRPLRFAGGVGTGFDEATRRDLLERLTPLAVAESPFDPPPTGVTARDAHWVEPRLVIQIEFGEWTADGRLRHPAYLGLRIDRDPQEVVRELTPGSAPRPRPDDLP